MSYEAGYTYSTMDGVDQKMHTIAGQAGQAEYGLPVQQIGLCAAAGLGWSTISDDPTDTSLWTIPVGLAAGLELPVGPNFSLTPHVMPMLVWQRVSFEEPITGSSVSDSDSAFGFLGGLTFGTDAFYVLGRAMKTTFERSETSFSIEGGFFF